MLRGTVTEFDVAKGLGAITSDDGRTFVFHCVEIADGTRTIAVGQTVLFDPLARLGAFEAGAIDKV